MQINQDLSAAEYILLIEDDVYMLDMLQCWLTELGYPFASATSAREGLALIEAREPALILLDRKLPDTDGLELCRLLRQRYAYRFPILMLTTLSTTAECIDGLNAGATDYIFKPVNLDELQARMQAHLRTNQNVLQQQMDYAGLQLAQNGSELRYGVQRLRLTASEYKLMSCLLRQAENDVPRDYLHSLIRPGQAFSSYALESQISGLRKKIQQLGAPHRIVSVYGQGYCLMLQPA